MSTPGPWSFHGSRKVSNFGGWEARVLGNVESGALVVGKAYGDGKAAVEANARLIAAAPELLDALKALCAWHDHPSLSGPEDQPVPDDVPCFDDTVKMVHAAIAKAEGT